MGRAGCGGVAGADRGRGVGPAGAGAGQCAGRRAGRGRLVGRGGRTSGGGLAGEPPLAVPARVRRGPGPSDVRQHGRGVVARGDPHHLAGGANFYIGNNAEATGTYKAPPFVRPNPAYEADDFASEASQRAGRTLSPGEVSRYWFGEGLRRWKTAPADSLRLLVHKLGLLLNRFEIPDNQSPEVVRLVAAPGLAWGVIGFGVLLPFAALGCLGRSPFLSFVALSNAGLLSTALFFVVGRYRIPWVPGLALLAGAGLVDTVRRIAAREWRGLMTRWLLLAVPAAAVAWWPMADPSPDRWGRAEIGLAFAFAQAGQLQPTIDALDDARDRARSGGARMRELMTAGPFRRIFASLASGRPTGPSGDALDRERARRLRQFPEGRVEARRLLETILSENPDDPETLRELGAWWLGGAEDPKTRAQAVAALAESAGRPLSRRAPCAGPFRFRGSGAHRSQLLPVPARQGDPGEPGSTGGFRAMTGGSPLGKACDPFAGGSRARTKPNRSGHFRSIWISVLPVGGMSTEIPDVIGLAYSSGVIRVCCDIALSRHLHILVGGDRHGSACRGWHRRSGS